MPTNTDRLTKVPEGNLMEMIESFKEIDEADIVTAFRDDGGTFSVDSTVVVIDQPTDVSATPITITGKMSIFGGPDDTGVAADEGLALFSTDDISSYRELFLPNQPPGTTGLARRLDPNASYIACRWDYAATPRDYLRQHRVKVIANGTTKEAQPVDFGPDPSTGRAVDLSPALAKNLKLTTDDTCTVQIRPLQTGVAVGINLAEIDRVIFPPDMIRQLVAMTTSNNMTYWVVNQIGSIESGQTLLRRVGNNAPEILLSDTTVFPIAVSDQLPEAVANELNKAMRKEPSLPKGQSDGAPKKGDDINARVFAKAQSFVGFNTAKVPGTEGGNLACAWAVNEVVRLALGKPISTEGRGQNGLGTGGIYDALRKNHTQVGTPSAGSIVISPTPPTGSVHGHVGIVGQNPGGATDNTQIFSNSSSQKKFAQNLSVRSWEARYESTLHLQVLYFNLNADQF